MNENEPVWQGYGDEECKTCLLIKQPGLLKACKAMVGYTALQIAAAERGNLELAVIYEGHQNDMQEIIGCWPGFVRV